MDLRQMNYVIGVVDHGGFTAAADEIGITQPSLSQAIRSLEDELGVALFIRSSRSVRLTPAGEAFIGPARQALRDAANARAAVDDVVGLASGRLDIVSLPTLAVYPAAAMIGRFRMRHPEVQVRLDDPEDSAAVIELIRNGESELGFTELPVRPSGLVSRPLEQQRFVALVPALFDRSSGPRTPVDLVTLAEQPMITTPPGTSTRRMLDESLRSANLEVSIAVETDHRDAIAPLVASGAGVAIMPTDVASMLHLDGVTIRDVTPPIVREIGIIHRPGPLSPAAQAFIELSE